MNNKTPLIKYTISKKKFVDLTNSQLGHVKIDLSIMIDLSI
jgi:hypothetical protein